MIRESCKPSFQSDALLSCIQQNLTTLDAFYIDKL